MTSIASDSAPSAAPAPGAAGKNRRRRARTPSILQMEATECGAAALAIVLGYFGRFVPLEVLRVACGVSRDGSKAANVLRAARSYGLEARGWRRELSDLGGLATPFVVFWNFNHFLVVEYIDYRRKRVWLNDPAVGPRRVTLDEFDQGYTGVCLTFRPGPDFTKGGEPPDLRYSLLPRLRGSRDTIAYVILVGLLLVVPGLAIPACAKVFVDSILVGGNQRWLMPLLIGLALTAAARGVLAWLQQIQLARLEMKLALAHTARFFWHILRLPIAFYNQRHPGDLNARVMANDRVAKLLSGDLTTNLIGLLRLIFYAAVMAAFDLRLTVIAGCFALLNLIAVRMAARAREDGSRRVAKQEGLLAAATFGGIALIETLKSSGTERDYFQRFAGVHTNLVTGEQELGFTLELLAAVPAILTGLANAAVLGFGGLRIIEGSMTVGDLVAFQSLLQSFNEPITGLVNFGGQLQTVQGDLSRLDDIMHNPVAPRLADTAAITGGETVAEPGSEPPRPQVGKLSGAILMRSVTFGYSRLEPPLLDGVDIAVEPGQRIALVGVSGSGKSTIAKLLGGLHQPWSGEIRYDGRLLAEIPHQAFAASVAAVDQDIFLFEGSVRDNVTLWDQSLDDAEVARALRDACLFNEISVRPGGLAASVLELGRNFSGGQRQRLEIARALVGQPTILILDEATAALDTVVESDLLDNLRRRGITCVIIAHRLSTVRDADEILMMSRGRIVERGTHAALIDADGPYRRLIGSDGAPAR
jgi:NHLM bacteriocin system ABC transporter peptidase/ATP-binding protein